MKVFYSAHPASGHLLPEKGEKGRQTPALRPGSPADVSGLESPAIRNPLLLIAPSELGFQSRKILFFSVSLWLMFFWFEQRFQV
jgi:hypothetical protein